MRVRGIFTNDSDNCLPHLPTSRAWPGKQGGRCPAPTLWWRTPDGRRAARAPRPRSEPRSRRAAPPPSATRDLRWTTYLHTPHTRTRRQSDRKDQEGAEREGLKVQKCVLWRKMICSLPHYRLTGRDWPVSSSFDVNFWVRLFLLPSAGRLQRSRWSVRFFFSSPVSQFWIFEFHIKTVFSRCGWHRFA